MAAPRRRSGKALVMTATLTGNRMAAPTPWITRKPNTTSLEGASPQASDARAKMAIPVSSIRRRPRMSPTLPPAISRAPPVSM